MNFSKNCIIKVDMDNETPINLFVKTLTGRTISIEIRRHATVQELIEKVYEESWISPESSRLIYAGKQLEGNRLLHDYNITN